MCESTQLRKTEITDVLLEIYQEVILGQNFKFLPSPAPFPPPKSLQSWILSTLYFLYVLLLLNHYLFSFSFVEMKSCFNPESRESKFLPVITNK